MDRIFLLIIIGALALLVAALLVVGIGFRAQTPPIFVGGLNRATCAKPPATSQSCPSASADVLAVIASAALMGGSCRCAAQARPKPGAAW
jgi:hypothetical protein